MTLEVCEMLELDDAIKGYKDILQKKTYEEKAEEKIDFSDTEVTADPKSLPSKAPDQTLDSDKFDNVRKDSTDYRKVKENDIIELSDEDDEIIIKSEEDEDDNLTENSVNQQMDDKSPDSHTAKTDMKNISQALTAFKDALEKHKTGEATVTVKQTVKHQGSKTTVLQVSVPKDKQNTNSSKLESQIKPGKSTIASKGCSKSYKHPVLSDTLNEKRKPAGISSKKRVQQDFVIGGYGTLLLPDKLTEDQKASKVFSQTGEKPNLSKNLSLATSVETSSQVKPSTVPQEHVYFGNVRRDDSVTKHMQTPVLMRDGSVTKHVQTPVNVPAEPISKVGPQTLKPLWSYTQVPGSGSTAIRTPRVSNKSGQSVRDSTEEQQQKTHVSDSDAAVPINVFRNISGIKGAILTAPMSEFNSEKQSSTDHAQSKTVVITNNIKPVRLSLSVEEIQNITPTQKFAIPPQLKERAREGLSRLMRMPGDKADQQGTQTSTDKTELSNQSASHFVGSDDKESNQSNQLKSNGQKPQNLKNFNLNTKESQTYFSKNRVEILYAGSDSTAASSTVIENIDKGREFITEKGQCDKSAIASEGINNLTHCPTDDHGHVVLDERKTEPLSNIEVVSNRMTMAGQICKPDSRLVVKLRRISNEEVMRWTKRKRTNSNSTTQTTPDDELTTYLECSAEPPVKTRRTYELPEAPAVSQRR